MNSSIQERVRDVVAETFGLSAQDVDSEASAQTLPAWTSLAHLRLVANLEQAFDMRFTMDEMVVMTSVPAIESVLAARNTTT